MKSANYLSVVAAVVVMVIVLDISGRRMTNAAALNGQPAHHVGDGRGFRIKHKPCWDKKGNEGTCMFQWECHRRSGQMLTTCIDRFLFGSCCQLPANSTDGNLTSTTSSTSSSTSTTTFSDESVMMNSWGSPSFTFTTSPTHVTSTQAVTNGTTTPNIDHIFHQFLGSVLANYSDNYAATNKPQLITTTTTTADDDLTTTTTAQVINDDYYNYDDVDLTSESDVTTTSVKPVVFLANTSSISVSVVQNEVEITSSTAGTDLDVDSNVYDDVYSDVKDDPASAVTETSTEASTTTTTTTAATTTTTTTRRPYDYKKDCGIRPLIPNGRIVGGTSSRFGEWPWQVLIKEATWLGLFVKNKCGGVLLNHKYVITAAHCQPSFLASLLVIFGESDLAVSTEELKPMQRNVRRVIVHRKFNALTFDNDLALLEMDRAVEYRPHVVPICLPNEDLDLTDQVAMVSGWGRLKYGGRLPTGLQHVEVPIIPNRKCQQMFLSAGHIKGLGNKFICAGYQDGGKDSCEGDSGGPLMLEGEDGRWILIGTVSHGIKCAYPNLPGVYINIAAYKSWILKVINS